MRTTLILSALLLAACGDKEDTALDSGVAAIDEDADGSPASEDCDDSDPARFPGNDEICDGVDNDCNDLVDDAAIDMLTGYEDADGDGYGDESTAVTACELASGLVELGGDCDDGNPAISPAAFEICDDNDVDEDCDGLADDADDSVDSAGFDDFFVDNDGDGFGDAEGSLAACDAPSGYVSDDTDCDDSDPNNYPGNGCQGQDRSGTYSGSLEIYGEAPSVGLSDTCVGSGEVVIDEAGSPVLEGTLTCSFQGILAAFLGTQTADVTGAFTTGSNLEGEIDVQGLFTVPWTGRVNGAGELTGEFSGSQTVQNIAADFEGSFTLQRE